MSEVSPSRILVFQTAFLGDVFLSIPLLQTLKTKFPKATIALVCRKGPGDFFIANKIADEVIEVNKKESQSLEQAFNKTKEFVPDLIISPHQSIRTAIWIWRLHAKVRIGFSSLLTSWAYTRTVIRDKKQHDVLRQLSLLQALDIQIPQVDSLYSKINVLPWAKMPQLKDFIALAPGSQWKTKRWPLQNYIQCAQKFIAERKQVVIVGGADESPLGAEIEKKVPGVLNLVGKTSINELSQLLAQSKLLITNDNGAMHVATTVGVPVVSIFGPTVTAQGYSPWSKKSKVVELDLACRPCGAHGHHTCPIKTHECMKKISSEKVLSVVEKVLS